MNIQEMIASQLGGDNKPKKARPLHEAQIMEMQKAFRSYGKNPFKPGDWITPRANCLLSYAGEPHLVVEVRENPPLEWSPMMRPGSGGYGLRLDARVMVVDSDGDVSAYWVESWMFEPYTPPVAAAKPEGGAA